MDKDGDCVVKLCEVVVKLSAAAGFSCSIDPSRLLVRICGEVWNYNQYSCRTTNLRTWF